MGENTQPAGRGSKRKSKNRAAFLTSCETLSWTFLERRLRLAQSRFLRMKRDGILYRLLHVWSTDTPGRWLEAMCLMPDKVRIRSRAPLAEVAQRITEIGSAKIGANGREPCSDLWGRGRGMVGLLRYYDLTKFESALEATRLIAGQTMEGFLNIEDDEDSNESALGILEGLVELSRTTQDDEYLAFAQRVAKKVPGLGEIGEKGGWLHLHSYITALRGLLGLYEASGEQKHLQFLMQQQRAIEDGLLWPTGGLPEMAPDNGWGETCQTADWFRLNLRLGEISHDKRYFDLAETTLFNHLAFGQKPEGGFTYGEDVYSGTEGAEGWACCNMSGARAMQDAWNLGNHFWGRTLVLNFYGRSEVQLRRNGSPFAALAQRTRFPDSGDVELIYQGDGGQELGLLARVPAWSPVPEVRVKGQRILHPEWQNGYVLIQRRWADGDEVLLRFPMQPRFKRERPQFGATIHDGVSTLWFGPRLFACARAAAPKEYQEATVRPGEIRVASRGYAEAQFRQAPEVKLGGKRLTRALIFNAHQAAIRVWLGGKWERFRAEIGLLTSPRYAAGGASTREIPPGEVIFEVLLDGKAAIEERLKAPGETRKIDVAVKGHSEMLLATTAIQTFYHVGEFLWANARLLSGKDTAYLAHCGARQVPIVNPAHPLALNPLRGARQSSGFLLSAVTADGAELQLPLTPFGNLTHQPMPDNVVWVEWLLARDTERRWDIARWTLGDNYCIWFSMASGNPCESER